MSMTRDEIIDLLTVIVSYDNRAADEVTVASFHDAARSGRWTYDEAQRAARDHLNARPDTWLKPGHITELIRTRRNETAERAAGTARRRPDDARVLSMVQRLADAKALEPDSDVAARRSPTSVACPFCDAAPDHPCTRPGRGGHHPTATHPSRISAAHKPAVGDVS